MTKELDGKAAIVTGGAAGIGAAIARRFARAGCRVVVADRDAAACATHPAYRATGPSVHSTRSVYWSNDGEHFRLGTTVDRSSTSPPRMSTYALNGHGHAT